MKNTIILLLAFSAAITGYQCGENGLTGRSSGLRVSGNLTGASGLQVFLDKTGVNPASASTVVGKADADASGAFNIELPENPEPGLYRLRAGAQRVNLVVDEKDRDIKLSGDLGALNMFQYQVSGSSGSVAYQQVMQKLAARQFTIEHLKAFVDTTSSPLAAMVIAIQSMGNNTAGQFMDIHKAAQARLKAASPNSKMNEDYAAYLVSLQSVKAAGSNFQFVEEAERQAAPDIRLPSPNGKEYALSDLKGKVVLLDFWASWCGPCRRENPNVVKIYEQYKDKGFTVFSVSLDGVDPRQMAALQSDPKNVAKAMDDQKKRWKDAITQDGLVWDYHVSELKKWDCAPAKQYGVSSIPRTFMIDKEGRIAASNLRGEAIEEVLLKLL